MGRSLKKGPFVDEHLIKKVEAALASEKKQVIKNLVSPLYNFPTIHRSNDCSL